MLRRELEPPRRVLREATFITAIIIGCVVLGFGPLACLPDDPPSTDAGADPEISDCCLGLVLPWRDSPAVCLAALTDPGECRWLTCLGGLVTYEVCR